jgi:hypothetical protein
MPAAMHPPDQIATSREVVIDLLVRGGKRVAAACYELGTGVVAFPF